jgi:SAM-dependent methyltransferase
VKKLVSHGPVGPPPPDPAGPWEVSTGETIAFLERVDPRFVDELLGILDVGAGRGRLARAMADRGHAVYAIEPDPEAAEIARSRRIPVLEADAASNPPQLAELKFGLIVFGRSLHHIQDIDGAVALAARVRRPDSVVVLEEFAHDRADEATARWLFEGLAAEERAGRIRAGDPDEDAPPGNGLARWQHVFAHDPPLHGERAMMAALQKGLPDLALTIEYAPYLYRWFEERAVEPDPVHARRWLAAERDAIARGAIRAVGLRVTASQPVRASAAPGAGSP